MPLLKMAAQTDHI